MKTLADVEFEDFLAWIGAVESLAPGIRKDLSDAANTVPIIGRLMMVHANAMRQKAPERDLQRSGAIINALVAVHFIMQGRPRPGPRSRKPSARRAAKARPRGKG